jgi:hypothetical protein
VAPLFAGQDVHATFSYGSETREFSAKVAKQGDVPEIAFTKPLPKNDAIPGADGNASADAFCACFEKEHEGKKCESARTAPSADCARTYAGDCKRLLACAEGDDAAQPSCDKLQANVGASHACAPLCGPELPCAKGTCVRVQGGDVCM